MTLGEAVCLGAVGLLFYWRSARATAYVWPGLFMCTRVLGVSILCAMLSGPCHVPGALSTPSLEPRSGAMGASGCAGRCHVGKLHLE